MVESPSNDAITPDILGMGVGQLYELAIFSLDESVRCAALGIGPEQLRALYRSIGMDSAEDSSVRSFNIMMLYLYLTGKSRYCLDKHGKVPWRTKSYRASEESLIHPEDMAGRLMDVLEAPKCLYWCMSPMCSALIDAPDADAKRNMMTVLWGVIQPIIVREDYEKIAQYFDPSALKSKKTRVKITRAMFYNILDMHRLLMHHQYSANFDDLKLILRGSETRQKKLAEINAPKFLNIDVTSAPGRAVYSAIIRHF